MEEFNDKVRSSLVKAFLLMKELNKVFMTIDTELRFLSERLKAKQAEFVDTPPI